MGQGTGRLAISIGWLLAFLALFNHVRADTMKLIPGCAVRNTPLLEYMWTPLTTHAMQTTCLLTTIPLSSCQPMNRKCLCDDQAFAAQLTGCVEANCTIREALGAWIQTL